MARSAVRALILLLCVGCAGHGCSGDGPGDSGRAGASCEAAPSGPTGDCIACALLESLGKSRLMLGGDMADATASAAPFDIRATYIAGGIGDSDQIPTSCDGVHTSQGVACTSGDGCDWWGCWQTGSAPPGAYVRDFVAKTTAHGELPYFTYYELLQSSGAEEGRPEVAAAADVSFMRRYLADYRFFLQQIGSARAFVHLEPDFWGYAEQVDSDPHLIPAAVASADPIDCGSQEDSIAGLGRCMIAMARHYAPNAKVGLHGSGWATGQGVLGNGSPGLDVAAEAKKLAAFLTACGGASADFVAIDASDRDAGWYQSIGKDDWWDATNTSLPDFTQAFTWETALTDALGVPAIWWQIPYGNMSLPNQNLAWKDNRLDYFFDHPDQVARANSAAFVFGAGESHQTTAESDGGHFLQRAKAYLGNGPMLCPENAPSASARLAR